MTGVAVASTRERLLELLRLHAYRRQEVVLASGKTSDFFIDCKQAVLLAEGHALVGALMLDALREGAEPSSSPSREGGAPSWSIQAVAGVELGGCPLASAVSLLSFQRGIPLDALYVRKAVKDHGTRRLVEGKPGPGATVGLLEDVITTGGSSLQAAATLERAGYRVARVVALVDRLEGGREAIEARYPLTTLYTRDDFPR